MDLHQGVLEEAAPQEKVEAGCVGLLSEEACSCLGKVILRQADLEKACLQKTMGTGHVALALATGGWLQEGTDSCLGKLVQGLAGGGTFLRRMCGWSMLLVSEVESVFMLCSFPQVSVYGSVGVAWRKEMATTNSCS